MSRNFGDGVETDEIIARLYDVALDPARYEDLLDQWEQALAPLRREAELRGFTLLDDAAIAAHFARADKVLDQYREEPRDAAQALIDQFDKVAALIIGASERVETLNGTARHALGIGEGAALDDLPIDGGDLGALRNRILKLLRSPGAEPSVFRVRSRDGGRLVVFHMQRRELAGRGPVVLAVTTELTWPAGFDGLLKSAFNFTAAETEIVRMLVDCRSLKEIADQRGRAIETVRAQLKSVLGKTETNSQIELLRLVLSMMDIAGYTLDGASAAHPELSVGGATLKPLPLHRIETEYGRRMDYLLLGDPKGRPVVYFPSDYGLVRWPVSAELQARRRGLKIIVPIRAGYGHSDPLPEQLSVSAGFTSGLARILAREAEGPCPFIAQGSDTYLAVKYAEAHPEAISQLICCAGTLPLWKAEQFERMDKWHRFIIAGAYYTPQVLPFFVKAGFLLARRIGVRGFVHAVYGNSPADIETFETPEVFEAMTTGSQTALSKTRSAHAAFSRQLLEIAREDWTPSLLALRGKVPITFMNGLQDPEIPPATLEDFKSAHDWIAFELHEDAGQLLFFRHWRSVLQKIR